MSQKTLLQRYNKKIDEEIHAREALSDRGALMTVIKGKRDVGVIDLNKDFIRKLEKYNIDVIPVRMTSNNTIYSIIYRDKEKAYKLYEIAKNKGGYFKDENPDEAREIGKLLGYNDQSINEYIQRKYGKKVPIRTDTEDDYDYLSEQKKPSKLNKKILKTIIDPKGNKIKICSVSGKHIKGALGFIEFVEGGHHYVDSHPGYKKYIPEDEIWIDEVFLNSPEDFRGILSHEWMERNRMKYKDQSYDKSHEQANAQEKKIRKELIHLKEDFQFNRMSQLLKRVSIYLFLHWFFL